MSSEATKTVVLVLAAIAMGGVLGIGGWQFAKGRPAIAATGAVAMAECGSGERINCVVDGDTFYFDGVKIGIADIDTPEVNPARCESEAALGARATRRLVTLLNAGPFQLDRIERDEDRYGRKLRVVTRAGRSIGDQLVREGLARSWTGRREPWR